MKKPKPEPKSSPREEFKERIEVWKELYGTDWGVMKSDIALAEKAIQQLKRDLAHLQGKDSDAYKLEGENKRLDKQLADKDKTIEQHKEYIRLAEKKLIELNKSLADKDRAMRDTINWAEQVRDNLSYTLCRNRETALLNAFIKKLEAGSTGQKRIMRSWGVKPPPRLEELKNEID